MGLVALAAAFAVMVSAVAQEGPAVTIPNFWNADQRTEAIGEIDIDVIRFVTTDDFPPFNFADADGRLIGFNVDLARAICDVLATPCTIQVRPFDDLIPSVRNDRADAAIAGVAITPQTQSAVAFSDVYLRLPARFVVRRGLPLGIDDLDGRTVAVVANTAHEAFLEAFFEAAEIVPYENDRSARTALRTGEADLLFGDGLALSFWLAGSTSGDCCQFAGGPYLERAFFGNGMAIAIAPDRPDLLLAVNAALREVYAIGDYAALYLRYFPVSFF